jgi:hypothetical protein
VFFQPIGSFQDKQFSHTNLAQYSSPNFDQSLKLKDKPIQFKIILEEIILFSVWAYFMAKSVRLILI